MGPCAFLPSSNRNPPRVRILVYSHQFDYSGAPIVLFRLIRRLVQRHEVEILLPKRVGLRDGPLRRDFEAIGVPCHVTAWPARYDVFLANTVLAGDWFPELRGTVPVLWWVHEARDGGRMITRGTVDGGAFAYPKLVVFPTRWQAESVFAGWLGDTDWRVVPYGIPEPETVGPAPYERRNGDLILLHSGTVAGRKGADVTLTALDQLSDPRIRVTFLGSTRAQPDFVARLKAFIAERPVLADTVSFVETVPPEVARAYTAHADAVMLPTRDDLITMTLLEAMQLRRCVVAADPGPMTETLTHGETALLSPPKDTDALARNIARLRDEPGLATRLGAAGHGAFLARHRFDDHVAAMEQALKDVAGG